MAAKKNPATPPAAAAAATGAAAAPGTGSIEIGTLFEQELQALNEDLRRQAALTMFYKLHPSNKTTVEQFIGSVKQHRDVWSVVSGMGVVDFAEAIVGRAAPRRSESAKPTKRTRLSEQQKNALKTAILKTLGESKDGLNRNEIAKAVPAEQLTNIGIERSELANKLRQPLGELVSDTKIHTVGEKRLMKYLNGAGPRKKS